MDKLALWLAYNWQQKLLALVAAFTLWAITNYSITATVVIPQVALRVINLPPDKTISDLLPTGYLARRIDLTVTGTKGAVDSLDTGDLEVVIDAKGKGDEWIVQLAKKNLISLNPDIDLYHIVNQISHGEFILKLSRRVTRKVAVRIQPPRGEPPRGYQFLDIWPQLLSHTVTGAEEKISELEMRGIDLSFDLSSITQEELDALASSESKLRRDEVRYLIPDHWKRVMIPFYGSALEPINDNEAKNLHIDFLRKELLPLEWDLPIRIYYPEKTSQTLNPDTYGILPGPLSIKRSGMHFLNLPLYVKDVSRLFLDAVKDYVELAAIIAPRAERDSLEWSVQFINPSKLEERYVKELSQKEMSEVNSHPATDQKEGAAREAFLRQRFRDYMQKMRLLNSEGTPLLLEFKLQSDGVSIATP